MVEPNFFPRGGELTLRQVATLAQVDLPDGIDPEKIIANAGPLETAGPDDVAYMNNPGYVDILANTKAGVCIVSPRFSARVPQTTIAIVTPDPYRVYASILAYMYPTAVRPSSVFDATGISPGSFVHPTARLEQGVIVDPGAVIGPHAEVGAGTVIGAHSVIGAHVRIGRDCSIGAQVSILNAFVGNRVVILPGARIGQDGFGFAMGRNGHLKVPQIGRVIIQDDVDIGANTTIDRGASRDTVIGEGTKIDNLVQIGHNVSIGRHCVIVAQVGIAGSSTLDDFVVIGGQGGVSGHRHIGAGAMIAGGSHAADDIPAGEKWGGTPAKPMKAWIRELRELKKLAASHAVSSKTTSQSDEE
ncbi:UDP-3-O-(3-hydroxymyristoyl)glucosamine N-acyltransferase [Microvirga sp. W0021]|uniref:UDP-3-O-acylglucosamine N-acyltransferase n=1 Tax=Hohaiivirga grylli TaxID=3133970 RepID=A0ABV0BIG6_9HYPH